VRKIGVTVVNIRWKSETGYREVEEGEEESLSISRASARVVCRR